MTEKINIGNYHFKEFSLYLTRYNFKKATKKIKISIFESLLENSEEIVTDNKIDINKINIAPYFIEENKKRLDNNCFTLAMSKDILTLLNNYENKERIKNVNIATEDYEYRNSLKKENYNILVSEKEQYDEVDVNELIPDDDYDYNSLIRNLEKNENLTHLFNHKIKNNLNLNSPKLQRVTFKVINKCEDTTFPIKYKIVCPEPNCTNIVRFTELDLYRPIKCGKDIEEEGHKLTISNKIVETSRCLYGYNMETLENDNFKELTPVVYSFEELKEDIIEAEIINATISTGSMKLNNFLLILSTNPFNRAKLNKQIISKTNKYFLEDIYLSFKDYLKEHHNILVRDDNKIVAHVLIFTLLAKIFHNKRFYSYIIGESGSGKTYWSKILPRLFTGLNITVNGSHVSKNIFLGGTSAKKSVFNTTMIQRGVVGTHDLVIAEEASNALNAYSDSGNNKVDNLFSMIKLSYEELVPITTQGTSEYPSRAVLFLTGNFEQLSTTKDYLSLVSARYKTLANNAKYSTNWPLFKSLEYYKKDLKNENLARAHYDIRRFNKDYHDNNYILRLPPAEMARFSFFIAIENNSKEEFSEFNKLNSNFNSFTHKEQIIEELGLLFHKLDINRLSDSQIPLYKPFFSDIYNYLSKEFFNKKQNFRLTKDDINQHIKINILDIARSFFLLQKQFYGKELKLLDEDKKLFENFMLYNYNNLSKEEANLTKRPYFNDYSLFDESLEFNRVIDDEEGEKKKSETRSLSGQEVDFNDLEEVSSDNIFKKMEKVE